MLSKSKFSFLFQKKFLLIVMAFLVGALLSGIAVRTYDNEQIWLTQRAAGTIVEDSKRLLQTDTAMLDASTNGYHTLSKCWVEGQKCDTKDLLSQVQKDSETYNSLIKPRQDIMDQLNLFYKQFHSITY